MRPKASRFPRFEILLAGDEEYNLLGCDVGKILTFRMNHQEAGVLFAASASCWFLTWLTLRS
jgi:hypothetical protein